MTSSFQSTAFRSAASPVDTFVAPPRVLPKTGAEELASVLQAVNPNLQKFIGTRIEQEAKKEANKAINDALDGSLDDFKETTKILKSGELIGGNIFYDRAFRRSKAQILGGTLETKLKNSYRTTTIDGKPLSSFTLDSQEYKNWESGQINEVIDAVGDIDEDTFTKKFLPYLIDAKDKINEFALKENQKLEFTNIEASATNIANNVLEMYSASLSQKDGFNKKKFLLMMNQIETFENDVNKLGLTQTQRSTLNKSILDSLAAKAQEIGYETGDEELARELFGFAQFFPYGAGGKLNLTNHPDFISTRNKLTEGVEDYSAKKDSRLITEAKRIKEEQLNSNLLLYVDLLNANKGEEAANLLERIKGSNPQKAASIETNAAALDGDTLSRYAQVQANIYSGNVYEDLASSRAAAIGWFFDDRTPKTQKNLTLLNKLMTLTGSVDKGILEPLNGYFVRYENRSKLLLETDNKFKIYKAIRKDQMLSLIKVNTEDLKTEFREWRLQNEDAGTQGFEEKYLDLQAKYEGKLIDQLNTLVDPSATQDDVNTEIINQNESGLEGVPTNAEGVDTNSASFFGNQELPRTEQRVITELQNMGGITKENRDNLITAIQKEKEKMFITNVTGKSEADRMIRFLQTGEYGFGTQGAKVYEPMKLLIDGDNIEAGAFSDVSEEESPTTVEVQQGDTLSQIAEEFGIPLKAFMEANNITNADLIRAGQELIVPMVEATTPNKTETKNKLPEVELNKLRQEIKLKTDKKQPLDKQQINKLLLNAGFTQEQAKIMTAIAMAESLNKVDAFYGGTKDAPEESYGLFQINMYNYKGMELGDDRKPKLGIDNNEALYDPVLNAIAAKLVFDETQAQKGNGYLAWGVYSKDGETEAPDARYKQFLD